MTFAELRDKFLEYISFSGYADVVPIPSAALLVNEAYREVSTESEWNWEDTTITTVSGTAEYSLTNPPDWIRITDVLYGTNVNLNQTDENQLRQYKPLWTQEAASTPYWWWISKPNYIRLHPKPNAVTTVYIHGSRVPTAFTSDTDTPGFSIRYHECIALRAAWLHLKKVATGDEYARAQAYLQESKAIVADLKEEMFGQQSTIFVRRVQRRGPERLAIGTYVRRGYG